MSTAPLDNPSDDGQQQESGLPLALLIHEHGDVDTFIATPTVKGDVLILELDDGREIELDRRELLDRAA